MKKKFKLKEKLEKSGLLIFVFSLVFFNISQTYAAVDWGYEGSHGPESWPGICRHGENQSPIEISADLSTMVTEFTPLMFNHYDKAPAQSFMLNNGQTLKVTFYYSRGDSEIPQIYGADLPGTFAFGQLHFHWGDTNDVGSEHLVDGVRYPLEMHMFHYNMMYGPDMITAIEQHRNKPDVLAGVSVLFVIDAIDNEAFFNIFNALTSVETPNRKGNVEPFSLEALLPKDRNNFFRYNGSLSYPPCNEFLIWTVLKEPVPISFNQLVQLRNLKSLHDMAPISHNSRPLQNKNSRQLLNYQGNPEAMMKAARAYEANLEKQLQAEEEDFLQGTMYHQMNQYQSSEVQSSATSNLELKKTNCLLVLYVIFMCLY